MKSNISGAMSGDNRITYRLRLHPAAACTFAIMSILAARPAVSQVNTAHEPVRPILRRMLRQRAQERPGLSHPRPGQDTRVDVKRARELITLFLRQGNRQPYVGEQITQVMAGGLESKQVVKHRGPWQDRIEFLSPPRMNGEIILQNGGRFLHYKPSDRVILEGVASPEAFLGQVRHILGGIKEGRITVLTVGSQVIAEQNASIVEIRTPEGGWRLWIDDKTGVRLKSEQLNAQGAVTVTSYFTKIDYAPTFDPSAFTPGSLPRARHEASLPSGPPLATVQAAQQQVDYTIREPALPTGFRLGGVWVVELPGAKVTVLRYTDGPNNLTLFEQRSRQKAVPGSAQPLRPTRRNLRHWVSGDVSFGLIGNVRPETLSQVVDSLQ